MLDTLAGGRTQKAPIGFSTGASLSLGSILRLIIDHAHSNEQDAEEEEEEDFVAGWIFTQD